MIREETRFVTDDGTTFAVLQDAQAYERWCGFRDWCRDHIEAETVRLEFADADVIAAQLWAAFDIEPKEKP